IDEATASWLGKIGPELYDKLAAVGLVAGRTKPENATLGAWLESYVAMRSDVKGSTATVYGHTKRNLIEHFGTNKPLADITAFDADAFRIWLRGKVGENTAKRRCGIAKQFFRAAIRKRLIAESPFADMKGISIQSNAERFYFVKRADAQKIIDAC